MPELRLPSLDVHASFVDAMGEFRAEGRGEASDLSAVGREIRDGRWASIEGFADFVAQLVADADPATPRPPGRVPCTTWWWCDGSVYLGRIAVRHHLTAELFELGGHIGYDVRPSTRRRGHATAMLAAILPRAHALGIDPVLVTCDDDNFGSRRVIEANHGIFEDQRHRKLRYWIATGPPVGQAASSTSGSP